MGDRAEPFIEDLGYLLIPRKNDHGVGFSRFEAILRSHPTEEHFDPELLRLRVVSELAGMEYLYINHPWVGEEHYRAIVGHVLLRDRKNKTVNSYAYGGDLRIEVNHDQTTCVLVSPAPIFRMEGIISIPSLVAQETEILLAEITAKSRYDHMVFEDKLSTIDPLLLYGASLISINLRYLDFKHKHSNHIFNLIQFIRHEIEKLQGSGVLSVPIPKLVDLF
jgi:hypothetical protein